MDMSQMCTGAGDYFRTSKPHSEKLCYVNTQNYSNCKSMLVVGCCCSCLWHETWLCLPECAEAECKVTADC